MPLVCLSLSVVCVRMTEYVCVGVIRHLACMRVCVFMCGFLFAPCGPLLRSSYKDCNTLHLPMERFSPVRRFSDGAATIQAFKAHLENSSLIKQLKMVHRSLSYVFDITPYDTVC